MTNLHLLASLDHVANETLRRLASPKQPHQHVNVRVASQPCLQQQVVQDWFGCQHCKPNFLETRKGHTQEASYPCFSYPTDLLSQFVTASLQDKGWAQIPTGLLILRAGTVTHANSQKSEKNEMMTGSVGRV